MPDPASLPGSVDSPAQRPSCVGCTATQSWYGRAFLFLFVIVSLVELFGTWTRAQTHLFEGIQIALLVYAAVVVGRRVLRYRAVRHQSTR